MAHATSGDMVARPGWRGLVTLRGLRTVSGLVLFTFVTMHLMNHALLLISIPKAEAGRVILAAPWRSLPGTVLLYGAAAVHLSLMLMTLYQRQTLVMRPIEFLRLALGLLIPYFIAEHVVATRLGLALYGILPGYSDVVRSLWVISPMTGVQQTIALLVVWLHGCIGVSFLIRHRPGWIRWIPLLLVLAVLLPTLALLGFAMAGRWLSLYGILPGSADVLYLPEIERMTNSAFPSAQDRAGMLAGASNGIRTGYIALVGAVLFARALRLFHTRVTNISVQYGTGERVQIIPGTSVLEASRLNGIPHYGICGGNARCSTCRVRVIGWAGTLPRRGPVEAATLGRISAAPDVRLACQLRPAHDIRVELVLQPSAPQPVAGEQGQPTQPPREREIAVLFCDLRGFTQFSEARLPYDVVFLLNRYFVLVGEAVIGAGGRIDKFIGDGAMALFGFETDAESACRSALAAAHAILQGGAELNRQLTTEIGVSFDIAIGIHFGPAVIGVMGFGVALSETAVGDTVNVASRLEAVAKDAGQPVAVSGDLLTRAGIVLDQIEIRPVEIRGRQEGIRVGLLSPERLAALVAQHPLQIVAQGST